ncbi:MAG: response regulator [Myxococcota bacterium]
MTESNGPAKTLLVVDDDRGIREALEAVLFDAGYRVACVADGVEALEWLRSHPSPSLILLDLMMPRMDGWQFRAIQRADPALSGIPVVVITAGDFPRRRVEPMGVARYLTKPLDIEVLLQTIQELV